MGLIHLLLDNGVQTTFQEVEVKELLARRVIADRTPFWKDGMLEWRPLSELDNPSIAPRKRSDKPITHVPIPGSLAAPSDINVDEWKRPLGNFYLRVNPIPLTVAVLILSLASMGAMTWFIHRSLGLAYGWDGAVADAGAGSLAALSDMTLYFFILLGLHIAVETIFFCWLFNANKNTRAMATNIRYTPGWSVACFFTK